MKISSYRASRTRAGQLISRTILLVILAASLIFGLTACGSSSGSQDTGDGAERYQAALDEGKPAFLYFYTDSCPACKKLDPIFQEVVADSAYAEIETIKVNAGKKENMELAQEHDIYYVPALFAYDGDGDLVWQFVGGISEDNLREVFDSLLN